MSAKLPNPKDKGRCARCELSFIGTPEKKSNCKTGNVCARYGDYCQYVAWNCTADSNGIRITDLTEAGKKVVREYIDKCKKHGVRNENRI